MRAHCLLIPAITLLLTATRAPGGDACPGDIAPNGQVDSYDLNILLGEFAQAGGQLQADINADGSVDSADLNLLLTGFGACVPVSCCLGPHDCETGLSLEDCTLGGGVYLAGASCGFQCGYLLGCGDPDNGSCCEADGVPGCNDADCCVILCAYDGFCCTITFDVVCAGEAEYLCGVCGAPCGPHDFPGSNDRDCDLIVCATLPTCCDVAWDAACVALALASCDVPQCQPDNVVDVIGACCIEGECHLYPEGLCLSLNGGYLGPASTCALTACP